MADQDPAQAASETPIEIEVAGETIALTRAEAAEAAARSYQIDQRERAIQAREQAVNARTADLQYMDRIVNVARQNPEFAKTVDDVIAGRLDARRAAVNMRGRPAQPAAAPDEDPGQMPEIVTREVDELRGQMAQLRQELAQRDQVQRGRESEREIDQTIQSDPVLKDYDRQLARGMVQSMRLEHPGLSTDQVAKIVSAKIQKREREKYKASFEGAKARAEAPAPISPELGTGGTTVGHEERKPRTKAEIAEARKTWKQRALQTYNNLGLKSVTDRVLDAPPS